MVFDYSKKAPEMANPRDWASVGCGRDSHQDKIANGFLPRKRLFIPLPHKKEYLFREITLLKGLILKMEEAAKLGPTTHYALSQVVRAISDVQVLLDNECADWEVEFRELQKSWAAETGNSLGLTYGDIRNPKNHTLPRGPNGTH